MRRMQGMGFWNSVEFLSDRGKPIARPKQLVRNISLPVAMITLAALAIAAVPLLLLNPDNSDGMQVLLSLFIVPMIAIAVIIELVVLCKLGLQEPEWTLLWWPLVVLPAGLLAMSISPMLAHRDYYDVTSFSDAVGVMLSFVLVIALGFVFGFLVWMLGVFPLRMLSLAAFDALRGDRVARFRVYVPLFFLAVPVLTLTPVLSLGELEGSRAAIGQIVRAAFGIPGDYEILWEPGIWIVRVVGLALIGAAIWAIVRSEIDAHEKKA